MASFTHNLIRVKAASGCVCGVYVVLSVAINPTSHYIGLAPATHAPCIQPLKHRPIPPRPSACRAGRRLRRGGPCMRLGIGRPPRLMTARCRPGHIRRGRQGLRRSALASCITGTAQMIRGSADRSSQSTYREVLVGCAHCCAGPYAPMTRPRNWPRTLPVAPFWLA